MRAAFGAVATRVSVAAGSVWTFSAAVLIILSWIVTGPIFGFSDTWQLAINTGTTIVTFLMVFLIQNTQNRDARAMQLKLDELIRAVDGARNVFIAAEQDADELVDAERRDVAAQKTYVAPIPSPHPPRRRPHNGQPH